MDITLGEAFLLVVWPLSPYDNWAFGIWLVQKKILFYLVLDNLNTHMWVVATLLDRVI